MGTSARTKLLLALGLTLLLGFLAGSLTGCDFWRGPTDNRTGGMFEPPSPSSCSGGCQALVCGPFEPTPGTEQPPPAATKGSPPKPPELIDGSQLPSDTREGGGIGGRGSGGGGGGGGGRR